MNNSSESSIKEIIVPSTDILLVSFGGRAKQFGGILPFEMMSFLNIHFPNTSKLFIIDKAQNSYHSGIQGITTSIEETVDYLKTKIAPYKHIYFLGVSAGGYAAILFGSLLKVKAVVAFVPQTVRDSNQIDVNPKYVDISPYIHPNTHYYFVADTHPKITDPHHASHCTRFAHHKNVHIYYKHVVHLPQMRNSGELLHIISRVLFPSQPLRNVKGDMFQILYPTS